MLVSVSYDYEGDQWNIDHSEGGGKIHMDIVWVGHSASLGQNIINMLTVTGYANCISFFLFEPIMICSEKQKN